MEIFFTTNSFVRVNQTATAGSLQRCSSRHFLRLETLARFATRKHERVLQSESCAERTSAAPKRGLASLAGTRSCKHGGIQ